MDDWRMFHGDGRAGGWRTPGAPPPWRDFAGPERDYRGRTYRAGSQEIELVNAALLLRRPLLITGPPGSGKSSLAYAVAHELGLGPVLVWPINSRSALGDGLYTYDALGRLREAQLAASSGDARSDANDIGCFIRLNALGTALYPTDRPRVLLIDEIDKSDIDLPGDLLHVLEEGEFAIPELIQSAGQDTVTVHTYDLGGSRAAVEGGRIRCREFPLIILTSNGERELPPAFFRRCLRLEMGDPSKDRLEAIVAAHLGKTEEALTGELIDLFLKRRQSGRLLSIDQLLNAVYLVTRGGLPAGSERSALIEVLFRELNR